MGSTIRFKICGLKEPRHVAASVAAGAGYLGFMFFEKSPRNLTLSQAQELVRTVPAGVARVAVTVNADDAQLDTLVGEVGFDLLQLHGSESPERVAEIKDRYGLPVMKAVGVGDETDLSALLEYGRVADQLLVDTKAPKGADLPGGNGLTFDWKLLTGRRWPVPWMLAGGLTAENVATAIQVTGAMQVDLSSAVEKAPGVKSTALIHRFSEAVGAV